MSNITSRRRGTRHVWSGRFSALVFAGLLVLLAACNDARGGAEGGAQPTEHAAGAEGVAAEPPAPGEEAGHAEHEPGEEGGREGHEPGGEAGHEGHEHGEDEVSDLDRPVAELFAATCEHGLKTHECDECRYEVGVARVRPSLLTEGTVQTAKVGREPLDAAITLTGEVAFDETRIVHLAPRVEGLIRAVDATLGQSVEAGAPLVEIDSVDLGDAQGAYLEARAKLALARRGADRQAALARERITSERELLAARSEAQTADIEVRAARERLLRLGLTPEDLATLDSGELGAATGRIVLRAPRAGVVLKMHAVPGESVQAGEEILLMGDPSVVWVWADLYEGDLAAVEAERAAGPIPAVLRVKAFPGEAFSGTLDYLSATLDEDTRTVKVRVTAANPQGRLRPGMFASVSLAVEGAGAAVVAVPKVALLSDEGRSFVFVQGQGEYYVRRPVDPGRTWREWVEIRSGLGGGETIVTEGAFLLKSDVLRSKMGAGCAD